ncbi:olfactory receptor DTMT, partial [Podarcis lilfordi]
FSELFLRGFPIQPEFQRLLFLLFLSMYLLAFLGNVTIIFLIRSDLRLLHAPMYFFLSHLAFADLGFISTTIPKVLENLLSQKWTISYHACLVQMYFFMCFGNSDSFLLASMAYDRYVAICFPLRYSALMSRKRCHFLAAKKAFSTCGSHIAVVVLFYGSVSWVYFKPRSNNLDPKKIVAAVMFTMVTPMLNAFIYSLRNSEIKAAMKRIIRHHFH